jgi:hypothetical protein
MDIKSFGCSLPRGVQNEYEVYTARLETYVIKIIT